MKRVLAISLVAALLPSSLAARPKAVTSPVAANAYAFNLTAIDGAPMPLAAYKGKVLLLVNTASFCGFTPQYDGLQKLHEAYSSKGFTVLGVPSGDFGGQEYAKNTEIKQFCESKFNVRFPMAEKAVVSGAAAIPLYKWAASITGAPPKWNFHKYLIGRDGKLIAAYNSKVTPGAPELATAIETALAAKRP